ncbi:unnamed protein product, partial [Ilex paraguariensis]
KQMGMGSQKRVDETGPSGGKQRKKKKNNPHTESIGVKNMTCEDQVDRPALGPNDEVIRAMGYTRGFKRRRDTCFLVFRSFIRSRGWWIN